MMPNVRVFLSCGYVSPLLFRLAVEPSLVPSSVFWKPASSDDGENHPPVLHQRVGCGFHPDGVRCEAVSLWPYKGRSPVC